MQCNVFFLALLGIGLGIAFPQQANRTVYDDLLTSPTEYGFRSFNRKIDNQIRQLRNESIAKSYSKCQNACALLAILLTNVSSPNQLDYRPLQYWSVQQSEVTPACRVDVSSAKMISSTILVSNLTNCPFAVRSGGHTSWAGGSSIQDGILINLANLNMVSLNSDRTVAKVGAGNNWYDVYKVLDPLGISVVGGREAGVGVGGLLLGGGISYFSGRYGWGCDNVLNYEVVLANGKIVNASPYRNAALYWALRGGSGTNFGIVSRFDLGAFEQGLLWGGNRFYLWDNKDVLVDTFAKFIVDAPMDEFAHLYISFGYNIQLGGFAGIAGPAYGRAISNATIFEDLNKIPVLFDTTHIASMGVLAVELNQTDFLREIFKTVTFKSNSTLMKKIVGIFHEEASNVLDVTGLNPFFAFQPLSVNIIAHMQKNGGNVLGLSEADGPLTIMNLNWGWANSADDGRVNAALDRFVFRSVELAKSLNLDHRFIYLNYATLDQDVFSGYGQKSLTRLKVVQKKYDPTGVFKRLQPGYFKL